MKKFSNKKIKDMKAITLIALVITIVVLIILAGVIISITLGNGGIINRAKTAKQEYANSEGYEQTEIAKASNQIDEYVDGNRNVDLASQTQGTATASDILKGKTAWVNGIKLTGTFENVQKGSVDFTNVSNSWQYKTITFEQEFTSIPKVYYDTNGGAGYCSYISEISTSSFTIGAYKSYSSGSITVNWIACIE